MTIKRHLIGAISLTAIVVATPLLALAQQAPTTRPGAGSGPMPNVILPAPGAPDMWSTEGAAYAAAVFVRPEGYSTERSATALVKAGAAGAKSGQNLRIEAKGADQGGVIVEGAGATYTLSNSKIDLSGDGSNDFAGLGAGALANGGSLTLRRVTINTHGRISPAAAATSHGLLRVYDSVLTSDSPPLPADYKPRLGAGMATPPPGLGIGGTARTVVLLNNSETYFYRSKIIGQGWGALSTDGANGYLYVEANDSEIRMVGEGYGTYADYGAHIVLNRSRLDSGKYAAIVAGPARLSLNDVSSQAGVTGVMIHSVMNKPNDVAVVSARGGSLSADKDLFLIKSANADITLSGVSLNSKSGVLLRAVVNPDFFATKVEGHVPGTRVRLAGMTLAGDFINEDFQRGLELTFDGTQVSGAIRDATIVLAGASRWTATADSSVAVVDPGDLARIDAKPGVTVTVRASSVLDPAAKYVLPGGGSLVVKAD